MAKVKFEVTANVTTYQCWVDRTEMTFKNDKCDLELTPGAHRLEWVLVGNGLSDFEIAITVGAKTVKGKDRIPAGQTSIPGRRRINV